MGILALHGIRDEDRPRPEENSRHADHCMSLREEERIPGIEKVDEKTPLSVEELFARVGLEIERVNPDIVRRLKLLNELTKFIEEEQQAIAYAQRFFAARERADKPFSEMEKRIVAIGMLFTDIGKTGPREAAPEQQRLIAEMFGVESVKDDTMLVKNFLDQYFLADAEGRTREFEAMGLDPAMTMRQFWNLHSRWTLEIIRDDGVPSEAVAAAATHHMLENINPDDIVGEDGRFKKYFGENAAFDSEEKFVILLDKYVAFRRRGGKTHEGAIEGLDELVRRNERYARDTEFLELLEDMRKVPPDF